MKKKVLYFIFLIAFSSCDKDENLPPNNNGVYIKTVSHSILEGGGIKLTGEIGNVELPINYGFIVSSFENGTYSNSFNSKIFTGLQNGEFTFDFKSNLRDGLTYYYNTIAFKNGEYIYGNEKTFISNGSADPLIESIKPSTAHLGDTITINGKHFSKSPQVFFNTRSSKTLVANDTLIKCRVINNHEYNKDKLPFVELKVRSSTGNETIYNEFALHTPRVDSIRPYEAFPGDTITIYGDHFNREPFGNRLIISRNTGSSAYPEVIKATQKELTFILRRISSYKPIITIESQSQSILVKNEIKHVLPQISGYAKNSIKYGDKLVIYGSNFPNSNSYTRDTLRYMFGAKQLSFFESRKDSLVIDIFDTSHYEGFTINGISINFFGFDISFDEEIYFDENYIRLQHYPQKINGRAYGQVGEDLYSIDQYNNSNKLVKLNKESNQFEEVYPGEQISASSNLRIISFYKTKFYWFEYINDENLFFSYDIFTKTKEQLVSYPDGRIIFALNAVVDDYLYYGLGTFGTSPDKLDDIWRYSFLENKWEFVLNFPDNNSVNNERVRPFTFSIGDKLYIGGGQSKNNQQLYDFWELDTKTNSVIRKRDIPIATPIKMGANVVEGKAFVDYNGMTYIYNSLNNEWSSKDTGINFNGYNRYLLQTEGFVYSMNENSLIKIKKEYFE